MLIIYELLGGNVISICFPHGQKHLSDIRKLGNDARFNSDFVLKVIKIECQLKLGQTLFFKQLLILLFKTKRNKKRRRRKREEREKHKREKRPRQVFVPESRKEEGVWVESGEGAFGAEQTKGFKRRSRRR